MGGRSGGVEVKGRYLEDFTVGQVFRAGPVPIHEQRIKVFAAEFDPQPFHLDDPAARDTIFGGLVASGWHTAAITMRLLVDSDLRPTGGIVGVGFDEFRWPRPVRAGDQLRIETEVLEVRPSRSRPDQGLIKVRTTTLNQNDEPVQVTVGNLVVPRRRPSAGETTAGRRERGDGASLGGRGATGRVQIRTGADTAVRR
jgi:acyl dehydratase